MICFPNAKINIGLEVINRRADNFHNIETVFYPLTLSDILEVKESERVKLTLTGLDIVDNPDNNLVLKAYGLLKEMYGLPPVEFHLHKIIPTGAGLGGGSSDAAYTLMGLNELFHLNIEKEKLADIASILGSDCAFFIHNRPIFAEGKGEIFSDVNLCLEGYFLLIVKPPISVSTAEAYGGITPFRPDSHLKNSITRPVGEWRTCIYNRFEKNVLLHHPVIGEIKDRLYEKGAIYAAMSGSGSTVYGLFEQLPTSIRADFPRCFCWEEKL